MFEFNLWLCLRVRIAFENVVALRRVSVVPTLSNDSTSKQGIMLTVGVYFVIISIYFHNNIHRILSLNELDALE